MPALREIFAEFGIEFDRRRNLDRGNRRVQQATQNLQRMDRATDGLSNSIRGLATAIGGAAIAQTMRSMVEATVQSTQELTRWAARLGITTREMNAWGRVARQFGGDMDDITDVLKELQLKARDAMTGTQSMIDAFALIGITVNDLRPVVDDQTALMDLFTDALNRNTSAATRNFVVDELLSDAGTRLIPMFRAGTEELRRMRMEADKVSRRQLPELEKQTRRYIQAQREWSLAWEITRNELTLQLLPVLTRFLRWAADAQRTFRELTEGSHLFEASLIAVGVGLAVLAALTISFWGPWVAGVATIAVLALIFDDIWVGLKGGKSVTEEWIDDLGTAFGIVDAGRRSFQFINEQIKEIKRQFAEFMALAAGIFALPAMIDTEQFGQRQARMLQRGQNIRQGVVDLGGNVGRIFGARGVRAALGSAAPEFLGGEGRRGREQVERGLGTLDPASVLRTLQPGQPPVMAARPQGQTVNQRISAPQTNTITIQEATDVERTRSMLRGELNANWQRQMRELNAAQVPAVGAGTGG